MSVAPGLSFASRHLDPGTRMGEVLFGLIMTLTFTLGAGLMVQEEGREGARQLLIATIGCNVAWGIIDGVFYVLGQLFERGRRLRIAEAISRAKEDTPASDLLAGEFDELLEPVTAESERRGLYEKIVQRLRGIEVPPVRVQRADILGGLAAGWLVFACSFPAALPFLFIDDPHRALRVSNALLLLLMFAVGYRAGRHAFSRPILTGGLFLFAGVVLVAAAIALGG